MTPGSEGEDFIDLYIFAATKPASTWIRDESLEESGTLPDPDILSQEIVEDLEAALEQFREIANNLGERSEIGKKSLIR